MPSMFPVSHNSDPGDRNRAINYWEPGDGIPGAVKVAFILFVLAGVGLLVSGVTMWTADRPVVDDPDHMAFIETVSTNMKWVGTVQLVTGVLLAVLIPGLLRGIARRRRWVMVTVSVALLFTLGGWVLGVGGLEQPLTGLVLALASLAMYRPAVRTFFGEIPAEVGD